MLKIFRGICFVFFGLGWLSSTIAGPEMRDGLWEITVRMDMPGMPMAMPPMTYQQCMKKDNMVPESPQHTDSNCRIVKRDIKGSTLNWVVECDTPEGKSRGQGTVTYHDDRFEGVTRFRQGGTEMTQRMTGKWLGPCP